MLTSSTWSWRSTVAGRSFCDDILRRDADEQEICPERFPTSTPERDAALSVSYGFRWRPVVVVRNANLFAVGVAGTGAAIGERCAVWRTSLALVVLQPLGGFRQRRPQRTEPRIDQYRPLADSGL